MTKGRAWRFALAIAHVYSMPLWLLTGGKGQRDVLLIDIARWVDCLNREHLRALTTRQCFAYFVAAHPEFRTVVHVRLVGRGYLVRQLARRAYPVHPGTMFEAETVGPGLFIHHGAGTMVGCVSIGANFWVNQHASIGYTSKGNPVIGDNVTVGAGAVVAGPITLADGTTIGANAVVVRSTEPGSVMVAPPAQPLPRRQEKSST